MSDINKRQFNKKKTRLYNSRNIKSQNLEPSYDRQQKVLDVNQFIQSRDYEIKSFEQSQLNSKNAAATRVFQALPRILRRRAASHNVKRIPKRLRSKAKREMSSSLPVKKLPRGRRLYKLMLRSRLLKVASKMKQLNYDPMDVSFKKLNIRAQFKELRAEFKKIQEGQSHEYQKLNNSVGAKDLTGINKLGSRPKGNIKYSKRQKEFVWIPTHIWHVKRFHMVKKYGFQIPYSPNQKCFKLMNRWNRSKSVCFDTSYFSTLTVTIPESNDGTDAFDELASSLIGKKKVLAKVLNGEKSYNGMIYNDGVQICPGFIYMNKTLRSLLVRVYPSVYVKLFNSLKDKIQQIEGANIYDCRYSLGSIEMSGPLSLRSLSKLFHFTDLSPEMRDVWASLTEIKDSDLIPIGTTFTFNLQDPRIWQRPTKFPFRASKDQNIYDLIIALNSNSNVDNDVVNKLFSVEGRTASYDKQLLIKQLGKFYANPDKKPNEISHSQIPVVLSKIDTQRWVFVLPWYWVVPFWIQLTKVTDVKPGGSKQMIQFQFENHKLSFPEDYPWLFDGWAINELVGEANKLKNDKLPKSQVSVDQSEHNVSKIFSGNKCDWHTLRNLKYVSKFAGVDGKTAENIEATFASYNGPDREIKSLHDVIQSVKALESEVENKTEPIVELYDKKNEFHRAFYDNKYEIKPFANVVHTKLPVIPISLAILNDGKIEDNARIYSTPDGDDFTCVGFVTTGSMNLNIGKCTGVGCIIAQEWLVGKDISKLYVRNPGKSKSYVVKFTKL